MDKTLLRSTESCTLYLPSLPFFFHSLSRPFSSLLSISFTPFPSSTPLISLTPLISTALNFKHLTQLTLHHAIRFVVAAGKMPCNVTLYNTKAENVHEFGAAHRNVISWSPHGRFLVVAGFGNLAGEMDFYDTLRLRKIGTNTAHCSVTYGWSPCSRYARTHTLQHTHTHTYCSTHSYWQCAVPCMSTLFHPS
jgi:hypothetical protein